ncbi:MAG: 30S ribosome-binding factor RbfA [Deltaproteobacteria bacterium]|jgi:ribosome-binding factor A|nr:30S ribosome-binding factor RbfA [Deltaproteobacteria bacterium]MBK8237469.1 30S ribosome-binding factor RbfA [Deltaproteobacteria bacterium]MBK8719936.1 30S ribosome-binding factor RbfA [Deltaproteobacteria bacterium]MBP7291416.1 30S ribosome-binding factor RbfA [Nannocystaceae bacterium]
MSERTQKVEQVLRREIAALLLRGELRDPRLQPIAAISITGVKVSPDLSSARVFVDALPGQVDLKKVLAGLNAGAGVLRAAVGRSVRLKRTPSLRFEADESIASGTAVEVLLAQIAADAKAQASAEADATGGPTDDAAPDPDED